MRLALRNATLITALFATSACSGESTRSGVDLGFRVQSAQFVDEKLPGLPPLTAQEIRDGVEPLSPNVTAFSINASLRPGTTNVNVQGRASNDTAAVALGLADGSAGHWIVPVGAPDPTTPGEFGWSASFDIGHSLAPGLHRLGMAAIGLNGESGTQASTQLCVDSLLPSNLNACVPTRRPPNTVISLEWDASVDLDLQVLTPSGKLVEAKHPTSAVKDAMGKLDTSAPNLGVLQMDGGAACTGRGRLREDLVFKERPEPGVYALYVNLYEPCAASSVRYELSIWSAVDGEAPATFRQEKTYSVSGIQLAQQANYGAARGQFLTQLTVD